MQSAIERIFDDQKCILLGENWSLFFGFPMTSSGHGIRDNNGTIEVKNKGGTWTSPLSEAALQLGTMSASISALELTSGTHTTSIGALILKTGTMTTTIGLHTLQLGTMSTTIATVNLAVSGVVTLSSTVNLGSFSASVGGAITGEFLTINDASGNPRKLAILS